MPDRAESSVSPSSEAQPKATPARRGHHKVYVGMAAGVGKTYRALEELRERTAAGTNAVIGVLEAHGRRETQEAARGLPVYPRRTLEYKGARLEELDVEGLMRLKPDVVLIDELAHANAPGTRNAYRHQDVRELLNAGIDVISTVNIQHLESLNDMVARLTGVHVRERLPDTVLQEADEVVLVDVTPQTLQARLRAGKIYAPEKVDVALRNFFNEETLTAMREIALREVADAVQAGPEDELLAVKERILVACALEAESGRLIRRGGRIAHRLNGELDVVFVQSGRMRADQKQLLETFRGATDALGGELHVIPARGSVGRTLVEYVREKHVTQVVLGESSRSRLDEFLRGSIIHRVLRDTRNVDVYVIARD